jgi:cellobiose dehydrogenase (acceptor)
LLFRLWYLPPDSEFTTAQGWPSGWQTPNTAINKLKARLTSTDAPSTDGKRYLTQVFDVVKSLLTPQGFNQATINDGPNQKDHVYGHPAYNFLGGKRSVP